MNLFIIVIAIAFIQVWDSENPLHKDGWLTRWSAWIHKHYSAASDTAFVGVVGLPVLAAAIAFIIAASLSSFLLIPLGVAFLLYSFGRGEFNGIVDEYTKACSIEDWETGLTRASRLGVDTQGLPDDDWNELHTRVLDEAGYRGFERMFAVLFWFFVLTPVGAFAYRVIFLTVRSYPENALAQRALWIFEWPVVRLLGLSFAFTGNFVGCFERLKESMLCARRSTVELLSPMIIGALRVDQHSEQTCEATRKELELLEQLYTRTLWLWLAAISFLIIFL